MEIEKQAYPKDFWNIKYTLLKNEGAISTSTWYFFVRDSMHGKWSHHIQ